MVENLISGESPIFDSKIIVFLVNKIPVFHGKWMVPWYPEIRAMISQGAMIAATSVFPFLTSPRLCSNLQCLPAVMDGYFPGRGVTGPEFQRGWEDMKGRRWISIYPLVICDSLPLKMAMKIVDLPINSMVIFHSYVKRLPEGIHVLGSKTLAATSFFFVGVSGNIACWNHRDLE